MRRFRTPFRTPSRVSARVSVVLLVAALLLAACSSGGGSDASVSPPATGPGITVDATKIDAATLTGQLRTIAANRQFAKVLKKEDDTDLEPKSGQIDSVVAQNWIDSSINQVLTDRELARLGLKLTPQIRAQGRKNAAKLFRGQASFNAFPKSFQDLVAGRQARTAALAATFPKDYQPTEAQLQELFTTVEQSCKDNKLVSQIYVDTRQEADAIEAQLAGGADFAELARQNSTDTVSAPRGGVSMCPGSTRFGFSPKELQQAVLSTPVGGVTAPINSAGDYVIMKNNPLTYENARELLLSDWHGRHPSGLFDFLFDQRLKAKIAVAKRFGTLHRSNEGVAIIPLPGPVKI